MQPQMTRETSNQVQPADEHRPPPRIRGWLLVYCAALIVFLVHGTALTIGSVVVYAHSADAAVRSPGLGFLLVYVLSNVTLISYGVTLFILMSRRRRSVIRNTIAFNVLSILFLVTWHLLQEKSQIGTVVDALPSLLAIGYFLLSRRVRETFGYSPINPKGRPRQ